jgi:glycosyltransferase involved in cell wall biosynthesis
MSNKINVLFMQSQTYFGADSRIHGVLMHYFDRSRIGVHAACNPGTISERSAAIQALESISDLHLQPISFGPTVNAQTKLDIAKQVLKGTGRMLASFGHLIKHIKQHKVNIIHCTEKPRDAFYGLLFARLTGAKCVIHLHVKAEDWISPLTRWAMHHADALVGVSGFVAESIEAMGYPASKTHVVLNGMELDHWDYRLDGSSVRREFGIAPDQPLLAVVSRLFPWKGHTELLKALAIVKQHVPTFRLLLVGEDDPRATPGGGSYTAQLKALTEELGLTEHIIFTGFRRDVPQIMAACDIFTMPSFEEPFGMVYLEAMAMEKPIIALNNGGAREVVEHMKSGLLSEPQAIEQLADNIIKLINDPALRSRMGKYGRRRCEQYFHPQRMANDTEKVYRDVLGLTKEQQPSYSWSSLVNNV